MLLVGLLAVVATLGLVPLSGRERPIVFDERLIDGKQAYLEELRRRRLADPHREAAGAAPNVVFMVADDLGPSDISAYGPALGAPHVETPHIDSIGTAGVRFDNAYATAAICAPSRAALLTGRHQNRSGFQLQPQSRYAKNRLEYLVFRYVLDTGNMVPVFSTEFPAQEDIDRQGLSPAEITIADAFGAAGYQTAAVGKWHLGITDGFLPRDHGFDTHYGFYEAYSLYAPESDPDVVGLRLGEFTDDHQWDTGRSGPSAIHRNGEVVGEKEYLTFALADEATDFIEDAGDDPYFLHLAFSAPHVPLQAPREYYDRFPRVEDEATRIYYAMISALDEAVGRVLAAVEESGRAKETVIVFTADNGGYEGTGATENYPFKAGKFSNFQGGLRVPALLSYPERVRAGTVVESVVSLMDFPITAMAAAGIPPAEDRDYDGVDLLSYLSPPEEAPGSENGDTRGEPAGGTNTPRPGDGAPEPDDSGRHAIVRETIHEALYWVWDYNRAVLADGHKLILDDLHGVELLYNIDADPGEARNLAEEYPNHVQELRRRLDAWEALMPPAAWPRIMNYRYKIGDEVFFFGI